MMWLASGVWRQSGTCVVLDNPSLTKEEDQTKLAPELAGRKPGDRGRGRRGQRELERKRGRETVRN